MQSIHQRHLKRIEEIKRLLPDYKLVEIWECEWDKMKVEKDEIVTPLSPRDALFGGRTNAIRLHYKCKPGEKIKYMDYTSLYPDIMKNGIFPIDHPDIITENFSSINDYFGLVKCKIFPPRNLYIPVLPARFNGKLIFSLCSKCASEQNQLKCEHSDEERALIGTWVTLEVQEALKHGYKVCEIYEVWDFKKKSSELFAGYINTFLKLKTEASGFPHDDHDRFIREFKEKEGIELERDNVKKNPGLRSVAKLMLNSFWGRFGMNTNKTQHKIINSAEQWFTMITNDQYLIHSIDIINPTTIQVFYSVQESFNAGSNDTNVPIAAFVTCQARLKLFREINRLGDRILYFDTDSIIFVSREGEYEPELGDFLGQFTNEIDKSKGNYIEEFVSAGPKNYSYKLDTGVTNCTVKGFNLNHVASTQITFESIKSIVCGDHARKIKIEQLKFSRDKHTWNVSTDSIFKLYGFVYDKRVIVDDLKTLPFGF